MQKGSNLYLNATQMTAKLVIRNKKIFVSPYLEKLKESYTKILV